jgi:hypothetical protein
MALYANRMRDPLAIAVHRERGRLWAQQAVARGVCTGCGQPHSKPGRAPGTRARRCEGCAVKTRAIATAWYRRQTERGRG